MVVLMMKAADLIRMRAPLLCNRLHNPPELGSGSLLIPRQGSTLTLTQPRAIGCDGATSPIEP